MQRETDSAFLNGKASAVAADATHALRRRRQKTAGTMPSSFPTAPRATPGRSAFPAPVASLEDLLQDVGERLERVGSGWLYVFADGRRMILSRPVTTIRLRGPQGEILEMGGGEVGWSEDGRFEFSDRSDATGSVLDNCIQVPGPGAGAGGAGPAV